MPGGSDILRGLIGVCREPVRLALEPGEIEGLRSRGGGSGLLRRRGGVRPVGAELAGREAESQFEYFASFDHSLAIL